MRGGSDQIEMEILPAPEDRRAWAIAAVLVGSLAVLDVVLRLLSWSKQPFRLQAVLAVILAAWLMFLILLPSAFKLASQFRLDTHERVRNFVLHIGAASLLTAVHVLLTAMVSRVIDPGLNLQGQSILRSRFLMQVARTYFPLDFMTYWTGVGCYYTLSYYFQARQQEAVAAKLKAGLAEAQLHTLRSQLNPHFLFNTLNAISVLASDGERDRVLEVIGHLSGLLRLALDEDCPAKVALADEMEFVDKYLEIQKIRFANRLEIRRAIEPDTLDALVPSMILQPLIENAIEHGVSTTCGPTWIGIQAVRENGNLRVCISDSGPGFKSITEHSGIGLRNTQSRLEQLYGPAQHLNCASLSEGGAEVTLVIPFEQSSARTVRPGYPIMP